MNQLTTFITTVKNYIEITHNIAAKGMAWYSHCLHSHGKKQIQA